MVTSTSNLSLESENLPESHEILSLAEDLTTGINALAQSNDSAQAIDKLIDAVSLLSDLQSRAARTPLHRPNITIIRATVSTLDRLDEAWQVWRKALIAPTMPEAQQLAKSAQRLLDSAGSYLASYRTALDSIAAYEDTSEPDLLKRLLRALSVANPNLSFTALEEEGASAASKELSLPIGTGKGIDYLILTGIAKAHFDPKRFAIVLKEAAAFCLDNENLIQTSQSPGAIEGLASTQRSILESLKAYESILHSETNRKSLLRRIITLYGEIFEDVAAPLFAWYCRLAGLKTKSYAQLMSLNATQLSSALLCSSVTSRWLVGTENYLRNAAGHGRTSYSINDDTVSFKLNSFSETVSINELLDNIFAFFESLAALLWGLTNALELAGIALPLSEDDIEYAGMAAFEMSCFYLERSGEFIHAAQNEREIWEIVLGEGAASATHLALSLAMQNQTGTSAIIVRRLGTTDAQLTITASLFAEVAQLSADGTQPEELLLQILRLRSESTCAGLPVVTRQDLRYAIGVFGQFLLSSNNSYVRHVRLVRKIALDFGYLGEVALIDRVMSIFRNPVPLKTHHLVAELKISAQEEAPVIPSSNFTRVICG